MDLIERQAAIDALMEIMDKPNHAEFLYTDEICKTLNELPSAQSKRLTDDDFETIRIHLSAFKERLCNQRRWEEAEEYQRIIERFMRFASAQPEIVRCKECKHRYIENGVWACPFGLPGGELFYCAYGAERRTDAEY